MNWFYLALLAPFLYAIVNLLDDNLLAFVYKTPYLACVAAGLYGALPLISRVFIHTNGIALQYALLGVLMGVLTLSYYFFYFKGLQSDTPSVVIALFGLAPATVPLFAYFIVHERLAFAQIIGFVLVLLASLALSVNDFRKMQVSKAFVVVAIAVVIMDVVAITSKYVYDHAAFYPVYLYFSLGMGLGGIGFLLVKWRENVTSIRKIAKKIKWLLPIFIAAELTGLAAEFVFNLAVSRGPVSLVKVIEGIQPVFVLLIALILYPFAPKFFREVQEGRLTRKFVLMLVIIIGLAIISLSSSK